MTRPNGAPLEEVRVAVLGAAKAMHARGLVEDPVLARL